ncbi:MAG: ABC transporter ATP-binding protein [Trebonia sp.]
MARVEIKGLSKSYGEHEVLRDLNIEVGEGEFLTLLGPSGCGKTTTLRCVAGLERAGGGEIRIGGAVVASAAGRVFVPPNRRDIGMVFQSYALWPHMTVAGNVAYPLRMRRKAGGNVRQQVTGILETVGMAAYAQRQVTDLSGGQQQRVALARAMVARPGLLLFDEPLSNLDAKLRRDMRREIRAAHDASGGSSIYVTHDQEEAITLSDRVVVLRAGVVQQVGTPRDIYEHPVNTFVADFVGYDNILAGTVTETSDRGCALVLGPSASGGDGTRPVWAANGQVKAATAGASAFVAVRAEHLALEPLAAAGDAPDGTLAAVITSRTYAGQHVEYVVEVGEQRLLIRMAAEQATEQAAAPLGPAEAGLAVGEKAAVRFNPARTVVIKDEAAR